MTTGAKEQEFSVQGWINAMVRSAWDSTGQRLAVGGWLKPPQPGGQVAVFHVATGAPSQKFDLRAYTQCIAWDPTGERLAAADRGLAADGQRRSGRPLVYIFN